jgi:hypothetical protein
VFENRVLRGIFGPKRDEVTGGWRKVTNEDLHNLYFSPSIIIMIKSRRMGWARHKAGRKRPVGGPRGRWEDNIEMDVREIGWGDMAWIRLAQDKDHWRAFVNTVMNVRVP